MYVKALSTVFGKCTGFDNIDLFVLHSLTGRTIRQICVQKEKQGYSKVRVHSLPG